MERVLRHKEEDLLFKGKNIHCRKKPLFEGWGDSLVYSGYFKKPEDSKEEEIVVRKIKVTDCFDKWEDIAKKHTQKEDPIKHDNVLKIISYEGTETDEWRFFALERYDATLEQFCKGIYKGPMPSDAQVLCQIIKGLLYLHKVRCPHGNLTPRTILIASSQPVRMMIKLSEFGLSKLNDQCDEELGKSQELCKKKYWILDYIIDYIADSFFFRNFHFFSRLVNNWKKSRQPLGDQQCEEETGKQQEFCLRKYWILNGTPTPNQDIFSAGCVCFYFLTRGVHPFGDDSSSILENIKKRNPVNLLKTIQQEKGVWEFAYDPIKNMIGDPPNDGTNWLMIAEDEFMKALSLKVDDKKVLGKGGYGVVYEGTFNGNPVAVKELERSDYAIKKEQEREMEEHFRLDHENVLKLLYVDDSRDKTCLVLELCAGTLTDFFEKKYKGPELPPDDIVLYQIAIGLHYIHSRNLVHRDVKPDNILISMTTPVQMKLSDFGFVKKTSPRGTFTHSLLKGTEKWMAPEILEHWMNNTSPNDLPRGTIQSDTFAAGCVFFYVATRGRHPFVEPIRTHNPSENPDEQIRKNVLNNRPKALDIELKKSHDRALYEVIGKMIKPKDQRISLPEVIEQLTTNLTASRRFKRVARIVRKGSGYVVSRFHPKEPLIACGIKNEIIFFFAENWSIPFSNWKEEENKFLSGHVKEIRTLEWKVDGTQLAAISREGDVIVCWSYPSGEILFQKKEILELNEDMTGIEWNPFSPNVFAAFSYGYGLWFQGGKVQRKVFLFNSCPVDQRPFHFYTIEREATSVQWISENRVALGLVDEGIEIWEIDESTTCAKIVKRLEHLSGSIADMVWDERTKCLAACSLYGWMKIWSMDRDQPIHAAKVDDLCYSLAWRPNGKQSDDVGVDAARKSADNFILAAGGFRLGEIDIWTPLDSKEKKRILSQHSGFVMRLSFSPDGRFLASTDISGKLIIWATENWEPVYINKEYIRDEHLFSWFSSSSTDVSDYKLTFDSYSHDGEVRVIEYAVGQNEKPSIDKNDMPERIAKEKETRGENSIPSSGVADLK